MRQFRQIAPAYFLPWDCTGFTGIEIGNAMGYLRLPGSLNAFVDFTAEVRNQGNREGFLFSNRKCQRLFEKLRNFRGHFGHSRTS